MIQNKINHDKDDYSSDMDNDESQEIKQIKTSNNNQNKTKTMKRITQRENSFKNKLIFENNKICCKFCRKHNKIDNFANEGSTNFKKNTL